MNSNSQPPNVIVTDTSSHYLAENLLATWLAASFMLMTTSLLFYHLTRVSSIEMNKHVAGLFAVGLIVIALILSVASVYPYFERITRIVTKTKSEMVDKKREIQYRNLYLAIAIVLIVIELGIAITITKGTLASERVPHKRSRLSMAQRMLF